MSEKDIMVGRDQLISPEQRAIIFVTADQINSRDCRKSPKLRLSGLQFA
jgi:hypothetical protein